MDEMKWAWVLFLAATLALLIRLAMWFLPAPGWRTEKVNGAAEAMDLPAPAEPLPAAPSAPAPELPAPEPRVEAVPAAPEPVSEPVRLVPPPEPVPVSPPPPEFHLRRVRWGMSPLEVIASESDVPLRENESGLTYVALTLELPCLLTYSFDAGRLVRARMSFSDPSGLDLPPLSVAQAQRRFLYLREQLRSRYGEPMENTVYLPRERAHLERSAQRQDELAKQYDVEIAEAERRLTKQRELLERRFKRWANPAQMVARGLAPYERDLKDLRAWKKEALDRASESRKGIQERQAADARAPLVATMTARWPYARELHDVELALDFRFAVPRLDIRYEATLGSPNGRAHEL